MTSNADLNQLKEQLRVAQQTNKEYHTGSECCYENIYGYYILGSGRQIYLLIRKCNCNGYITREVVQRHFIPFEDIVEGVEVHLSGDCHYSVKRIQGQYVLEKVCFCPR